MTTGNNLASILFARRRCGWRRRRNLPKRLRFSAPVLSKTHPYESVILNNLGTVRRQKGYCHGAESTYPEMLAIRCRKSLARSILSVANASFPVSAGSDLRCGQFEEAETRLRDALKMEAKLSLGDNPYVADTQAALGLLLSKKGDLAECGTTSSTKPLALRHKLLGQDLLDVAAVLDSLAILRATGDSLASAEQMLRQAVVMDEKLIGAESPDLLPAAFASGLGSKSKGRRRLGRNLSQSGRSHLGQAGDLRHERLGRSLL